jgi:hypothetical protein
MIRRSITLAALFLSVGLSVLSGTARAAIVSYSCQGGVQIVLNRAVSGSFRGRIGYHWGGIICPSYRPVPGTFQVCN